MNIEENISLAGYSTFKTGGVARYFCIVRDIVGVKKASDFASEKKLPFLVIGGGSNMLFPDSGFSGLVIKNEIMGITESLEKSRGEVFVEAGAGVSWDDLVALCVSKGYWGIENLSGIPGSVGASPVQNIGAYGSEVKEIIESVRVFDIGTGQEKTMNNAECGFSYRDSVFKNSAHKNLIITSVFFRLKLSENPSAKPNLLYRDLKEYFIGKNPSISEIRNAVLSIRSKKFPDLRIVGTAGSFWKNPIVSSAQFHELTKSYPLTPSFPVTGGEMVKIPLAWILDNVCGLKGFSKGKVGLYKNQPLVLVAESGTNSSEINDFAKFVEAEVRSKTGIEIEREVNSIL